MYVGPFASFFIVDRVEFLPMYMKIYPFLFPFVSGEKEEPAPETPQNGLEHDLKMHTS